MSEDEQMREYVHGRYRIESSHEGLMYAIRIHFESGWLPLGSRNRLRDELTELLQGKAVGIRASTHESANPDNEPDLIVWIIIRPLDITKCNTFLREVRDVFPRFGLRILLKEFVAQVAVNDTAHP